MIEMLNLRGKTIRVRIPATTSNLGPGFDVLGLALELYNEIELKMLWAPAADRVEISGEGENTLPRDRTNLVVQTARRLIARHSMGNALSFRMINRIPIGRGLGSSAAARLGGILAARTLLKALGRSSADTNDEALLETACLLEGHPDNIVPAFFGGLCISYHADHKISFAPLNVPRELSAVVCVPDFELSTEKARQALPKTVSRQDAVQTAARVALFVRAIERRQFDTLKTAMQDVLHQPYRRKLVPGMERVIQTAVKAGAFGAALSGAGPSIFAFAPRGPRGAVVGRAMQKAFAQAGVDSRYLVLGIDRKGAVAGIAP